MSDQLYNNIFKAASSTAAPQQDSINLLAAAAAAKSRSNSRHSTNGSGSGDGSKKEKEITKEEKQTSNVRITETNNKPNKSFQVKLKWRKKHGLGLRVVVVDEHIVLNDPPICSTWYTKVSDKTQKEIDTRKNLTKFLVLVSINGIPVCHEQGLIGAETLIRDLVSIQETCGFLVFEFGCAESSSSSSIVSSSSSSFSNGNRKPSIQSNEMSEVYTSSISSRTKSNQFTGYEDACLAPGKNIMVLYDEKKWARAIVYAYVETGIKIQWKDGSSVQVILTEEIGIRIRKCMEVVNKKKVEI